MIKFGKLPILYTLLITCCTVLHAENAKPQDPNIALVQNMQQTLLVDKKGTSDNIDRFYAKDFRLNNIPCSNTQMQQRLQHFYSNNKDYHVVYRDFTVSGNNVSWFETVSTTDKTNHVHNHEVLELAVINQGKIDQMYIGGQ